ncbi:MAG: hypothetical protein M5U28_26570 [Sandaracinaceae bacterium]|nr:hypothetical protein [Sandaracinaceae bacterium]
MDFAIPASIAGLRAASASELESLYGAERSLDPRPHGLWRGHYLQRLDNRGARAPLSRLAQRLLFRTPPWGIDFDRGRWFFLDRPRLAAGHFAPGPGRRAGARRRRSASTTPSRGCLGRSPACSTTRSGP